jgi:BMFP domain-containing protein YqiC
MKTQAIIDDLSNRLSELMAKTPVVDIKKNTHALLSGLFAKMDLVTREEFDVQMAVLARTRARLIELEEQVALLEKAGIRVT